MLKYIESFDHLGGVAGAMDLYTALGYTWAGGGASNPSIAIGYGRLGTNALNQTVGSYYPSAFRLPVIPRKCNKMILGFSLGGGEPRIIAYFRYGTFVNFSFMLSLVGTTMYVGLCTGTATGDNWGNRNRDLNYPLILWDMVIPYPCFSADDYHFVELYLDVTDYMNGRAKIAIDGITYVDKDNIVTAAYLGFGSNPYDDRAKLNNAYIYWDGAKNYGYGGRNNLFIDSIYLADDEGGYQDDFLGDIFVKTFYPVADGTKRNWMPYVNGTIINDENPHHELIDNDPIQQGDETEYLEADQDLTEEMVGFGTNPIPAGSELIAVNHRTMFRNVASPGSPKSNSLVPLFQMIGNPIVRTDSLSKKLTGWTYGFLDVYYDIVPVSAALWEEYLLEQAEFGFMLRTAENLQRVEEETQFADEAIVEGDGEDG